MGTDLRHPSQGIHPGAARAAHARAAVRSADGAVDGLRLRREPGRGPRAHRLDGHGPHARRAANLRERFDGVGPLRHRGDAGATKRTCSACWIAARRRRWCACCRASRAIWRAGAPTEVQVLIDGTNSNTASLVSSYAGVDHRGVFGGRDASGSRACKVLARSPGGAGERGGAAGDGAQPRLVQSRTSTAATISCRAWSPTSS